MKIIKNGEYVRFKNGVISQMEEGKIIGDFLFSEVVRIDPDIIYLVEIDDYVDGKKVISIEVDDFGNYNLNNEGWTNRHIKSIVTHEQFSQMEYRIEE